LMPFMNMKGSVAHIRISYIIPGRS
jgi:hypothetical protein